MATEVIMPQLGSDMKQGTIVRWVKSEGAQVKKGEVLAEVETDKAVVELEANATGVLKKVYVIEGTPALVGQVIGVIAAPDEDVPNQEPLAAASAWSASAATPKETKPASAPTVNAPTPQAPAGTTADPRASVSAADRVKASPLARKEAAARGVDLALVAAATPAGRVTLEDVIAFADKKRSDSAPPRVAAAAPVPASSAFPKPTPAQAGDLVPLTRMRQAIARAMGRSKREIPHYYLTVSVDMTEAMRLREQRNAALGEDVKVSVNDLVIRAVALALVRHPRFNASWTDEGMLMRPINVGMAVALEDGLVAPCIPGTDTKGIAEIARQTKSLAERARSGHLTQAELFEGTFNVTNLGMYQVDVFAAIITPPQSSALSVGTVKKTPVVKDSQIMIADIMQVELSGDHRVSDGAQAAVFLGDIRALLEGPLELFL